MGRYLSPRHLIAISIGLLLIIAGVALILEGQALGDQTVLIGTGVGLSGMFFIAAISSLDLFSRGKDNSE
ncbi:MAG TPA: hypothetical protein VMW26_04325 [Methanomassiliicoccales archaeon]|nr:hypothetical protein [Methanomassiliicoccales archaeon]